MGGSLKYCYSGKRYYKILVCKFSDGIGCIYFYFFDLECLKIIIGIFD